MYGTRFSHFQLFSNRIPLTNSLQKIIYEIKYLYYFLGSVSSKVTNFVEFFIAIVTNTCMQKNACISAAKRGRGQLAFYLVENI